MINLIKVSELNYYNPYLLSMQIIYVLSINDTTLHDDFVACMNILHTQ